MKNSLGWVCSVLITLSASTALADDELPPAQAFEARCAPELQGAERGGWEDREVNGQTIRARWFPDEIIQCITRRLGLLPRYAVLVATQESRIEETDERVRGLERQIVSAEEGEQEALGAVEAALRRAREAEESRDAWHRSRVLWFAVGVIVTGALVALTAYALDSARP